VFLHAWRHFFSRNSRFVPNSKWHVDLSQTHASFTAFVEAAQLPERIADRPPLERWFDLD